MTNLNEFLFEMLIHLDFEPSFFQLFEVCLDLQEHRIGRINVMLIIGLDTLIRKSNDFLEDLLWAPRCNFRFDRRQNQINFLIISIFLLIFLRLTRMLSFDLDCIFLVGLTVFENHLALFFAHITSHERFYFLMSSFLNFICFVFNRNLGFWESQKIAFGYFWLFKLNINLKLLKFIEIVSFVIIWIYVALI